MCRQIVKDTWENFSFDPLRMKIKCCSTSLAEWGKDITGRFKERISSCNKILKTKYFHACASNRKKNNQISRLENNEGVG